MTGAVGNSAGPPANLARPGPARRALAVIARTFGQKLGRPGLSILAVMTACALLADVIAPYDPAVIDYRSVLSAPSWAHWFGTDELGRDVLSRVIHGARISLFVVAVSVGVSLLAGTAIGFASAMLGGFVDSVLMRIMDALLAFPMIILALGIIAALGPSLTSATIALAIVNTPGFARLVRIQVMSLKSADYILSARAIGASGGRIVLRHMLPNIVGPLIVYASVRASAALITESALAFLGLGAQPPTPTWGSMLAVAVGYWDEWWLSVAPGLAIFVVVLGFNFAGDALRDVLDVRLDTDRAK